MNLIILSYPFYQVQLFKMSKPQPIVVAPLFAYSYLAKWFNWNVIRNSPCKSIPTEADELEVSSVTECNEKIKRRKRV